MSRPPLTVVGSNVTPAAKFWGDVTAEYPNLNTFELELVRMICNTMQAREEFHRVVEETGLMFYQRDIPTKLNPAFNAELACDRLIVRLLDQLGLIAPLQKRPNPDDHNGNKAA
jgi:hypothetical protein